MVITINICSKIGFYGLSLHSGMMSCLLSPVFFSLSFFFLWQKLRLVASPPPKESKGEISSWFCSWANLSFSLDKNQNDQISFCFWEGETYDLSENETYLLHRLSDTSSSTPARSHSKRKANPKCMWCDATGAVNNSSSACGPSSNNASNIPWESE